MPTVDLIDETYIVAAPEAVSVAVHDPLRWQAWWPELSLSVFMDRGLKGIRWSVSGRYAGSAELWLEEVGDGVVVHFYLRVDPVRPVRSARSVDRLRRRTALSWKRQVNALKDELEARRAAGEPRTAGGGVKTDPDAAEEG